MLGGDFDFFFDSNKEAMVKLNFLKNGLFQNLSKSKKALIYGIFGEFGSPKINVLCFVENIFSRPLQKRLDYVFVSNIFFGSQ